MAWACPTDYIDFNQGFKARLWRPVGEPADRNAYGISPPAPCFQRLIVVLLLQECFENNLKHRTTETTNKARAMESESRDAPLE